MIDPSVIKALEKIEQYSRVVDCNLVIDFNLSRAWLRDPGAQKDLRYVISKTWENAVVLLSYTLDLNEGHDEAKDKQDEPSDES